MAVKFFLDEGSAIMSDGDWNGAPDDYFQLGTVAQVEDDNEDVEDSITLDTDTSPFDTSGAAGAEIAVDLVVLGDHNHASGETLTIESRADGGLVDTSTLLKSDADDGFWSGDIFQTDGLLGRPNMGAQPDQGDLFVIDSDGNEIQSQLGPGFAGDADFTADTVTDIINEEASLISKDGEAAHISGSFDADVDQIIFDLEIPMEFSAEDGVDISQTTATASLSVDFDSGKDISNMVFYFTDGAGDCLKLKIDDFDDYWDNLNPGFDSTSTFDMLIDDDVLKALFDQSFAAELNANYDLDSMGAEGFGDWTDDWEFAGFSTKAGNNRDQDYSDRPRDARGEGEYIGLESLAEDCYGKLAANDFSIDAAFFDGTDWISNIDDLFA